MPDLASPWLLWALLSAFFAALTIFAKIGVENVNSDLATFIRTIVLLIVLGILAARGLFQPLARIAGRRQRRSCSRIFNYIDSAADQQERGEGVWALDAKTETKLRQLGDRADKFKMMQRALKEAGIDRAATAMALFERGPRKAPLIGKVVGVGIVDEITDRTWVVVDAVDGRVHYAELGRLRPADVPVRGTIVALAGDHIQGKPSSAPRLQVLSAVEVERQAAYDGPTWPPPRHRQLSCPCRKDPWSVEYL